jgi:hypothetical protein
MVQHAANACWTPGLFFLFDRKKIKKGRDFIFMAISPRLAGHFL